MRSGRERNRPRGARALLTLILIAGATGAWAGEIPKKILPAATNVVGYLRVDAPTPIALPASGIPRRVGEALLLFEATEHAYLAVSPEAGDTALHVFPRIDHQGRATAWRTQQQQLVFGQPGRSEAGTLLLSTNDFLVIVAESGTQWSCVVERVGREAVIAVPKAIPGLAFLEKPTPEWQLHRSALLRDTAASPPPPVALVPPATQRSPPVAVAPARTAGTNWVISAKGASSSGEDASSAAATAAAWARGTATGLVASARRAGAHGISWAMANPSGALAAAGVGGLGVALVVLVSVRKGTRRKLPPRPAHAMRPREVFPTEPVRVHLAPKVKLPAPAAAKDAAPAVILPGDLRGELKVFSMGQVVQFFHSSGESGTLTISNGAQGDPNHANP